MSLAHIVELTAGTVDSDIGLHRQAASRWAPSALNELGGLYADR